jgi:lysophospholipid acyltransferase (LPLAT)-like uncharacterized protein
MFKRLLRSRLTTAIVSATAALYLHVAFRTTRWELDGAETDIRLLATEPVILAFWHERLLLMPMLWRLTSDGSRGGPKADVLISRHHDGLLIARTMAWFGARAVHGSSASQKSGRIKERGGAAALRRLAGSLELGRHVLVTPDGPRGPARSAKPGLVRLAILSGRPILPAAAISTPHLRLPTWDRMMVPLPFARGRLTLGSVVRFDPPASAAASGLVEVALDDAVRRCDLPWD